MAKTLVVKLGTSSLFDENTLEHRLSNMAQIVEMVVDLRKRGYNVCLVSSGGIAAGLKLKGWSQRPKKTSQVQALAALGQASLMRLWDELFQRFGIRVGQVLLTRNDISDRLQYKNACNTLEALLEIGAIPIVNENDTLTAQEIRFGDNDTLSSIVAHMLGASSLFILTDVDALYTSNPRVDPSAKPIRVVKDLNDIQADTTSSPGSGVGTGGMVTKLIAANLATSAGIGVYVCRSFWAKNVSHILKDVEDGISPEKSHWTYTYFVPHEKAIKDRAFWLLHGLHPSGVITIDSGAYKAVTRRDRAGLLPVGVQEVKGNFHESECVEIWCSQQLVGRCLVNYSSIELQRIKGHRSTEVEQILGYADSEYVAYRDNLAFFEHPELTKH